MTDKYKSNIIILKCIVNLYYLLLFIYIYCYLLSMYANYNSVINK